MADDTISVALVAETAGFKAAMGDAAQSAATFSSQATQGLGATTNASESLLKSIAGGGHARHLRLLSMELGGLAGAGQLASRETFALLGGMQALSIGMESAAGPIGMVIAALGVLVTAFTYLTGERKKHREEQEKADTAAWQNEQKTIGQVAEHYAKLAGVYREAGYAKAASTAQFIATADRISALDREQETLEQRMRVAKKLRNNEEAKDLSRLIALINADKAALKDHGRTVDEDAALETAAAEKLAEARIKANHEWNQEYMLGYEARRKALKDEEEGWRKVGDSAGATFVSMAHQHKKFLDLLLQQAEEAAEKAAASAAISGLLGALFPGIGAVAGKGGLLSALAGAIAGNDARKGVK